MTFGHVAGGGADRGARRQKLDLLLADNVGHNLSVHEFLPLASA
jgi:hypothetical protein